MADLTGQQGKALHTIIVSREFGTSAPDSQCPRDTSGPESTTQRAHLIPDLKRNVCPWLRCRQRLQCRSQGGGGHLYLSAGSQGMEELPYPAQQLRKCPPAEGHALGCRPPNPPAPPLHLTHIISISLSTDTLAGPRCAALYLPCLPYHQLHNYTRAALHLLSSGPWLD